MPTLGTPFAVIKRVNGMGLTLLVDNISVISRHVAKMANLFNTFGILFSAGMLLTFRRHGRGNPGHERDTNMGM